MEKYFRRLNPIKFKKQALILFILGDLLLMGYFYLKFADPVTFDKYMSLSIQMTKTTMPGAQMPEEAIVGLREIYLKSLQLLLGGLVIFHWLIFFLFSKEKKSSWLYLRLYVLFGAPGCLYLGLTGIKTLAGPMLIPAGLAFAYILAGFLYLNHSAFEKKAR